MEGKIKAGVKEDDAWCGGSSGYLRLQYSIMMSTIASPSALSSLNEREVD